MEQLHDSLQTRASWYREWHTMRHNQLLSWLMFVTAAFLFANLIQFSIDVSAMQENMLSAVVRTRVTVIVPEKNLVSRGNVTVQIGEITPTSAVVNWSARATSSVFLQYGEKLGAKMTELVSDRSAISGNFELTDLKPNTVYVYSVQEYRPEETFRASSRWNTFRTGVR